MYCCPGVSTLARLVSQVRDQAAERMYRTLAEAAASTDAELPYRLRDLLTIPDGQRVSELELLRRAPIRTSGIAMNKALERVSNALAIGARAAQVQAVPANRLAALARYGLAAKAPQLAELAEPRKTATLLATARNLEAAAVDDALDLFDLLMATRVINPARRATNEQRLAVLPRLEKASALLLAVNKVLLEVLAGAEDGRVDVATAWAAVETVAPREQVVAAQAVVDELLPDADGDDTGLRANIAARYGVVRPFVELLAEAMPLDATPAGLPLLREVHRLPELLRRRVSQKPLDPAEVEDKLVPLMWRPAVFANRRLPQGTVDRDAYVLCLLDQLRAALRRRDVFAHPSLRWSDPRAHLLVGADWLVVRDEVLAGLGLGEPVEAHLAEYAATLDAAWRLLAQRIEEAGPDASVRIVPGDGGRMRLSVEKLEALGEPASLASLRKTVATMLPRVDLPELLMEVHSWTGCFDEYVHVGDLSTRIEDLPASIAALLVAEACNVGLTPVTKPGEAALTRDRLSHVDQNYVRAETHAAANARLIEAQAGIDIAGVWGGGLLASVDGLRFVVPVRTINAAPSPRYFGLKRGGTWLNAVNDQVAGIGAVFVPGTRRDSLRILDTLLNLDAGPKPEMVTTDTASYSDIVFGLFRLLGYRFSPRIADMGGTQFWRTDPPTGLPGGYGPLDAIARGKVNLDRVRTHWPDMLRVAGSLVTSKVRAYDLIRMISRDGNPTPLGQAFAEYGRVDKTLHLLAMVDPVDESYRRRVTRQLNIQESRHRLARKIFHGQRGELRQAYREGQEDQLGALGLVLNAVVLWNTRYVDAAVTALRAAGQPVPEADAGRLSPLGHEHINLLGRYAFPRPSTSTALRALRDPDTDDRP